MSGQPIPLEPPGREATLVTGTVVAGRYRVEERIGSGGSGDVYRAFDTPAQRFVALKVLTRRDGDTDRAERVRREAKALTAIHHPNVASLYGIEEIDAGCVLVLELVDGPTLSGLVREGPLPVAEVIRIGSDVCRALEAAHEKGVVHRDLKPDNVRLSSDSSAKVLDFGVARTVVPEASERTADGNRPTREGELFGTPAYMAPEQLRGLPTDARADLWALGVVLWELLTGRNPFLEPTVADTVAAVLGRDLDWRALPSATPRDLVRLLQRCLERDVDRRLRHAGDALLELQDAAASPVLPSARPLPLRPLAVLGAVALAGIVAWAVTRREAAPQRPPLTHLTVREARFSRRSDAAISSDGRFVAYAGTDAAPQPRPLYVRMLDRSASMELSGTAGAINPFFSPDGRSIAYFQDRKLWRMDLDLDACVRSGRPSCGGTPEALCETDARPDQPTGAWGRDGTIVVSRAILDGRPWPGLVRIPAAGGPPVAVTTVDEGRGERAHSAPEILPGGRWVLLAVSHEGRLRVDVASMDGRERHVVLADATAPRFADGMLLVYRPGERVVQAAPFDEGRRTVTGPWQTIARDVMQGSSAGRAAYAVSAQGTLVYTDVRGDPSWAREVVWMDRAGRATPLLQGVDAWSQPRLSPDGRRLLVRTLGTPDCSLWLHDLASGARRRVGAGGDEHDPVWNADGHRILFASARAGGRYKLWTQDVDRTAPAQVVSSGDTDRHAGGWSADGARIAFSIRDAAGEDVWMRDIATGTEQPIVASRESMERQPELSPDGAWLAYTSDLSGRDEVYVRSVRQATAPVQVSSDGGSTPRWSPDGRELFFVDGVVQHLMAVSFDPSAPQSLKRARVLFAAGSATGHESRPYDVGPGALRFVVLRSAAAELPPPSDMHVVLGWRGLLASPGARPSGVPGAVDGQDQ